MLDPKFVRSNLELVEKNAQSRNLKLNSQDFSQIYDSRSISIRKIEELRNLRKKKSASVKYTGFQVIKNEP